MRQFYYVIQTLLRGRGSNITKIISLTLGLFVGILLFARVAFEMSFDSNYKEVDKLCVMNAEYYIGGEKGAPMQVVMAPVPAAVRDFFPEEIESATVVSRWWGDNTLFNSNIRMQPRIVLSDSLFFRTMGIEVLKGIPAELANPEVLFVSQSFARRAFGEDDPIGKVLMYNKTIPMIVKGVYADVPENCSLRHDVVISFATIYKNKWAQAAWNCDDSYEGFVRLRHTSDIDKVNARIDQAIEAHMPFKPESGFGIKYSLEPIRNIYIHAETVRKMVMIMSLLGFAILLLASLNYVLISVSSIPRRSKAVGVHKCNGASGTTVFGMFLWETAIILFISLLLVGILMINFREAIENITDASLTALFTWRTMWVPLLVIFLLFMVAGVLPGRMLSGIPVTLLFRRYTDGKKGWKRSLLFVQFAGVTFIFGVLCVVLMQYHRIMTKEMGYDPDRVAFTYYHFPGGTEAGKAALRLLPMVENVSVCTADITSGYGGGLISDENGKRLFTSRFNYVYPDYTEFMKIELKEGRSLRDSTECLVNEEFVRHINWPDSPIGHLVQDHFTIVGIMKDFPINSFYERQAPVTFVGWKNVNVCWHVRLKEPFEENLRELNRTLGEMFTGGDIVFKSLPETLEKQYTAVRRFRDAVMLASVSILLIALMGLIGYINDETRRRSKEIAIRKVNGAEAASILRLLSRDIALTAVPAVSLGILAAYFTGKKWLEQFAEQIDLNLGWFVLVALAVMLIILSSVVIKAWNIANQAPVNSIKSE